MNDNLSNTSLQFHSLKIILISWIDLERYVGEYQLQRVFFENEVF